MNDRAILRGLLHVPGGVVAAALLLLAVPIFADEIPTATHVVPFIELNGYTTDAVILNTTDGPIEWDAGSKIGPPLIIRLDPHETLKNDRWPVGTDIAKVTVDARLSVYSQIRTPRGSICQVGGLELQAAKTLWFHDLPTGGEFESHIWIAVPEGDDETFVTIDDPNTPARDPDTGEVLHRIRSFLMPRGALVLRVFSPTVRVHLGAAPGWPALPAPSGVYAFASSVQDATGAITPHVIQ